MRARRAPAGQALPLALGLGALVLLAAVAGFVNLAHSLVLVALSEGVDTEAQAESLRTMGCDLAQGYLWSRPYAVSAPSAASYVSGEDAGVRSDRTTSTTS